MLTTHSPWGTARSASPVPSVADPAERANAPAAVASATSSPERSVDADQAGHDAIEGRDNAKPATGRRAIGIMFGIDPKNLYETPDDEQNRDQAVRDLD